MTRYEFLVVERVGAVGWLILDRPDAANAINSGLRDELPRAWAELDDDDDVRVIVTTGSGRSFCAGADVKEIADDPRGMAIHEDVIRTRLTLTAIHNDIMKPVICAVNGICAGGGLHFVADADIVVASSNAVFLDPHVSVGQVSVYETVGLLARMPLGSVARMAFTGVHERMDAREAHRLGLVSEVVDPPEELRPKVQESRREDRSELSVSHDRHEAGDLGRTRLWAHRCTDERSGDPPRVLGSSRQPGGTGGIRGATRAAVGSPSAGCRETAENVT